MPILMKTKDLRPGMVVTEPVRDERGRPVRGLDPRPLSTVNRQMKKTLLERGVQQIPVYGTMQQAMDGLSRAYAKNARDKTYIPDALTRKLKSRVYRILDLAKNVQGLPLPKDMGEEFRDFPKEVAAFVENIFSPEQQPLLQELRTIYKYDEYTFEHSVGVAVTTLALARKLEQDGVLEPMAPKDRMSLALGALLHDIGKVDIPEEIIKSTGRLTDEQFARVKEHPETGVAAIDRIRSLLEQHFQGEYEVDFSTVKAIVGGHHLRPDGRGYGVSNVEDPTKSFQVSDVPPFVWIVGIADAYDAMVTDRPYRAGMQAADAVKIIEENAGKQFYEPFAGKMAEIVAPHPESSLVILADGMLGQVTKANRQGGEMVVLSALTDYAVDSIGETIKFDRNQVICGAHESDTLFDRLVKVFRPGFEGVLPDLAPRGAAEGYMPESMPSDKLPPAALHLCNVLSQNPDGICRIYDSADEWKSYFNRLGSHRLDLVNQEYKRRQMMLHSPNDVESPYRTAAAELATKGRYGSTPEQEVGMGGYEPVMGM